MADLLPFAQVLDKFPALLASDSLQLPPPLLLTSKAAIVTADSPMALSTVLPQLELGNFILDLCFVTRHPGRFLSTFHDETYTFSLAQRPLVDSHVQQFIEDIEGGLLGPYHQNSPLLVIATGPCPIVTGPGIWSHPVVNGEPVHFQVIAGQHRLAAIQASNLWPKHWKCVVYHSGVLYLISTASMA